MFGENYTLALYTSGERKYIKNDIKINNPYTTKPCNNSLQRIKMRKKIKKQQAAKFKIFVVFFIIFGIIMPKIFFDNLNSFFLHRFQNKNIQMTNDMSFLNQSEFALTNDGDFLDTKLLDPVNTQNPLMKSPVLKGKMNNLTIKLKNLAAQYPQIKAGVFIWDYDTGKYVNINGDNVFPTASVIKIPVMFQVFRRVEKGLINLNDKISLTGYYVSGGSGYLQYSPPGRSLTYRHLVNLMIQESDNTATNMLLSSIGGMNELNREIKKWGLPTTSLSNWLPDLDGTNISTPKEMGTLLYNIGNTDLLSIKNRAEIINIMSHVRNRNLIQAGLPDDVMFIHKTGDIGTMLGDAGVVALPDGRKYIISIMVKRPWNYFPAKQFIIDASKITYDSYIMQNQ